MRKNLKLAWIASWFALVGQLLYFFGVSIFTGEWRYVMWSLMVSVIVGIPSMIRTWQTHKKRDLNKGEKTT
ncbi:hypothetical protein [Pontibacillus marinus]|uniref:Uncharacterized protein n=1 Tax=Pontibacillus marinus BH030004 = DSM 16465 TaxID=1385511 RepID=A0A0A5G1J0_9BACI|nr:hypothetical protein [Pontibacillus marinus]KGX85914.1 hypothetical protein N783_13055 [Pontibacillus marinus BH030004 = DSM 16465]